MQQELIFCALIEDLIHLYFPTVDFPVLHPQIRFWQKLSLMVAGHAGIVYKPGKCTDSFKRPLCPLPVHPSYRAGLKSGLNLYKNHKQGAVGDFGAVDQFRIFWIALRDYV